MKAVAPGPLGHHSTGEFIDDHHLVFLDNKLLVSLLEHSCAERSEHKFFPTGAALKDVGEGS